MWRRIGQGSYRCRGCWPRRGQNMVSKSHRPYNICFRTLFPAEIAFETVLEKPNVWTHIPMGPVGSW